MRNLNCDRPIYPIFSKLKDTSINISKYEDSLVPKINAKTIEIRYKYFESLFEKYFQIRRINIIENKFIKTSFLANLLKYTAVGDTARKRLTSMHDINFMCLMKKYGIKTKILPQIA